MGELRLQRLDRLDKSRVSLASPLPYQIVTHTHTPGSVCGDFYIYSSLYIMKGSESNRHTDGQTEQTCMNPLMGLEVRTLGVDFGAARKITMVDATLLQLWIITSIILD